MGQHPGRREDRPLLPAGPDGNALPVHHKQSGDYFRCGYRRAHRKNSAYPYVELTRLEQSMKKWEIGANFAAHEDFVKLIREGNFTLHQAKCICYDIVSLFVKTVDKMNITEAVE